jgi:hypothetical protein
MGQIYRIAEDVAIFLGQEKDDSAMVMQYLNYEDVELREGPSSLPNTGIEDTKSEDIETAAAARIIQQRIEQCGFDADRFLRAADAFCKRPWWSRMWVVQEFHLPKREPRWYCGRLTTSTAKMSDRLEKLINHLINEAPPMIGNPEVFNDKTIIARILNNIFHLILPLHAPQVTSSPSYTSLPTTPNTQSTSVPHLLSPNLFSLC